MWIWNVCQPGSASYQLLPQPPLDTEMRSGDGAPPLHAAITPVVTASAAVSAARRTLAPIRYEFRSSRVPPGYSGQVPWPGPCDPLTKRSLAGNRWFATLAEDAMGEEGHAPATTAATTAEIRKEDRKRLIAAPGALTEKKDTADTGRHGLRNGSN